MDEWAVWLLIAGFFAIVEMVSTTFFAGMLAVGAAAAMIADLLGAGGGIQLAVFAVVSLGMLVLVRPVARRHVSQPAQIRTGVDALPGSDAVVLETVDDQGGRIKLAGEVWSARSTAGMSFEPGEIVRVVSIDGATAVVA